MSLKYNNICDIWKHASNIKYKIDKLDSYNSEIDCENNYFSEILYNSNICNRLVKKTIWNIKIYDIRELNIEYTEISINPSNNPPKFIPYILIFLLNLYKCNDDIDMKITHYNMKYDRNLYPDINDNYHHMHKKPIIKYESLNGGFTDGYCKNWNISLYRSEEVDKVFMHEMLHNLCQDVNTKSIDHIVCKIANIENIKHLHLSEAYIEAITEYLYTCIISNYNYELYKIYMNDLIKHNTNISYSMSKFLDRESPIDHRNPWIENTNAYAYYVIKTVLLYHINDIIENPLINLWPKLLIEYYSKKHNWIYIENLNMLPEYFNKLVPWK